MNYDTGSSYDSATIYDSGAEAMATWANLTAEQRDVYSVWERDLRAVAGEFQRLLDKMADLETVWDGQILSVLAALDDNTVVPNSSGLAGSESLNSDSEAAVIRADFDAILTTYNTAAKQQLRGKAAGLANL